MNAATRSERAIIEGNPVLVVIDIQGGGSGPSDAAGVADSGAGLPFMDGYQERMEGAPGLIEAARRSEVPVVFFQEAHRRDLIDFGRELDGAEGVHLPEGDAHQHDYFVRVVEDVVAGSSLEAHEAALNAMEYLQTGARRTAVEIVDAFVAARAHEG